MVNVIVRDIGDITLAIEKLIEQAVEEGIAENDNELQAIIDEKQERIYELEETIQKLYTEIDERNEEIKNLHRELMGDD